MHQSEFSWKPLIEQLDRTWPFHQGLEDMGAHWLKFKAKELGPQPSAQTLPMVCQTIEHIINHWYSTFLDNKVLLEKRLDLLGRQYTIDAVKYGIKGCYLAWSRMYFIMGTYKWCYERPGESQIESDKQDG